MTSTPPHRTTPVLAACLAAACLVLSGCARAAMGSQEPTAAAQAPAAASYRPHQQWRVPGEWEFTVDSVRVANVRLREDGGGAWMPRQVVILTYSYGNLGFDDSANFTNGGPSTLAFSKAHLGMVDADDSENVGPGSYPVRSALVEDVEGRKVGQEMIKAQWPFAFAKKVRTVKVTVGHYDSRLVLQVASFVVPVQAALPAKQSGHTPARHT
ncbi:hypothetical protein ACDH70_16035 [Xanthomonas axonopodis pv. poinsettiicola]|uniref:hypothetical protein n=1 Tax=Xanthomonas TaxID=338 RepID=UPI001E29E95A|nr:hypothetical protein [Xanthomonas codiaei]MCC8539306.1 hypothetical protein [Xanthomonas codiaei]